MIQLYELIVFILISSFEIKKTSFSINKIVTSNVHIDGFNSF